MMPPGSEMHQTNHNKFCGKCGKVRKSLLIMDSKCFHREKPKRNESILKKINRSKPFLMLFPSSMMNVVLEDTDSNHMIFSW
jgi:hypothetical protein